MLVDRTASDVASARQRNFRFFVFAKKSAQEIVGRTDFFNIFIINAQIPDGRCIDPHGMAVDAVHGGSDLCDCFQKYINITDIRQVFDQDRLIGHRCCRKNCKRRVFCSPDFHFAHKRISTSDDILFHIFTSNFLSHT